MGKSVIFGFLFLLLFAGIVSSSSTTGVDFVVGSTNNDQVQTQGQTSNFNAGIYIIIISAAIFGLIIFKAKTKSTKKSKPTKKKKSTKKKKKSKK